MYRILQITTLMLLTTWVSAQGVSRDEIRGLDEQIQDVKQDVIGITAELAQLEEKLLFPSNSQTAVFVSLKGEPGFDLEAVELRFNGEVVAHHLYTFRELEALQKGGVQKLYTANLRAGTHPLEARVIGKLASGKQVQAQAAYSVDKAVGPKFVEIQIVGAESKISFKDW